MNSDREINAFLRAIAAAGGQAHTLQTKLEMMNHVRELSPGAGKRVDELLLLEIAQAQEGLLQAQGKLTELEQLLEKLTAPPWHSGVFKRSVERFPWGRQAVVAYGNGERVVSLVDGLDLDSLAPGDEVYLGPERNIITGKSPYGTPRCGDTAFFERHLDDGRMICKWRDESIVLEASGALAGQVLKAGDEIRWDRAVSMAYEKIERAKDAAFFLSETPDVSRDQIGGQGENLDLLLSIATAHLVSPEKTAAYQLGGRNTVLLCGPPGCGKTLMGRILAAELGRLSGEKCCFVVVNASNWESPWVGQAQANIRDTFRSLREASGRGPTVLLLDEVESIGRIRGHASGYHSDKFLSTLLTEIDGFDSLENVMVLCATNNTDLLDPALYERISQVEVKVSRPDLQAARAIFSIHLPQGLPYGSNGVDAGSVRNEILETAVSKFYSPNGDNDICTLRFRDGTARKIKARELASGRLFEQVCRTARQDALQRSIRGQAPGVSVTDIERAVTGAIDRLRNTLTPRNASAYIQDLPHDLDVVAVDTVKPRVRDTHEFLNVSIR